VPLPLPTSKLPDKQWQKSLLLTITIHVSFLVFGFFAPNFLNFRHKMPEVYTVNLFSVEDLGSSAPAAPNKIVATPQAPIKAAPPAPIKLAPAQKIQPHPEPPAVAKDTISLKPIKTKEKADIDKVKMLRDKLLAENNVKQAKDTAEKALADSDKKTKGAVDSLKQSLMAGQQLAARKAAAGASTITTQNGPGTGTGSGASGGITVDENLRRYLVAVNSKIQEHWVLPDLQSWKENIEAIVIIRVRRDGVVVESTFKKKSDNIFFNQFVEKTLKLSSPLPPFPIGMNQQEEVIGLKFRPGEIF
jgi:outer membrane biosynthesis protein TonB